MPKRAVPRLTTGVAVGIDPSLTGTGLAVVGLDGGDPLVLVTLRPRSRGVDRLVELQVGLAKILRDFTIEHIAMEGYGFNAMKGAGSRAHSLGEAGGAVKLILRSELLLRGRPLLAYPSIPVPQQIKKFATGKGNAPKDQVSKHVYKKWGVDARDNNQADAYAVARIAMALATGQTELKYEQEVIDAMTQSGSIHAEAPDELRYG